MQRCWTIIIIFIIIGCGDDGIENMNIEAGKLIFQSGFEEGSRGLPEDAHRDIFGIDLSKSTKNDWENDLDEHPNIGNFTIQYEGGFTSERFALITRDPVDVDNRVLHFWLDKPNVRDGDIPYKGRIQGNLYGNNDLKEIYQKVDLYFDEDFNILKDAPAPIGWLTIFEFWNNATWTGEDYQFRISIDVKKVEADPGQPLNLGIHGQEFNVAGSPLIWQEINTDYEIPVAEWLTLEIYFKEGNEEMGRFYLAITEADSSEHVIFDIRNFTHHSSDPDPDGLGHLNPMKLYLSDELINYVSSLGGTLQLYWDNLEFWTGREP